MKKIILALFAGTAVLFLSGCGDKPKAEVVTYKYTPAEVYKATCSDCHGEKGEGMAEKKGPALNKKTLQELEMELFDVKNGGLGQSTATEHGVMEHNMKKLSEKGYTYDINAKAKDLFVSFNINK